MPMFTVLLRRDAIVAYTTTVEAASASAAAKAAQRGSGLAWKRRGIVEFDAERVVTLDAEGEEIEATACGDF